MFYGQSPIFLDKIKKADRVLINIHKNADYDSFASALAVQYVLKLLKVESDIVSCQPVNPYFHFLKGAENIKQIDYSGFDFSPYDLFIIPDTGSFDRVTGSKSIPLPEKPEKIIIDHHITNKFAEPLRILDEEACATCEVLNRLFDDWGIATDKFLATLLMTGILGDTVYLRYAENNPRAFEITNDLVKKGADVNFISENFYEKYDMDTVKLLGEFLSRMKYEEKGNFVWSAIPYETFEKFGMPDGVREMAADLFFRGIKGVDYGLAILEAKKGELSLSFRSKKSTDVTPFAKMFGGGGHKNAAGANCRGEYDKTINELISKLKSS